MFSHFSAGVTFTVGYHRSTIRTVKRFSSCERIAIGGSSSRLVSISSLSFKFGVSSKLNQTATDNWRGISLLGNFVNNIGLVFSSAFSSSFQSNFHLYTLHVIIVHEFINLTSFYFHFEQKFYSWITPHVYGFSTQLHIQVVCSDSHHTTSAQISP